MPGMKPTEIAAQAEHLIKARPHVPTFWKCVTRPWIMFRHIRQHPNCKWHHYFWKPFLIPFWHMLAGFGIWLHGKMTEANERQSRGNQFTSMLKYAVGAQTDSYAFFVPYDTSETQMDKEWVFQTVREKLKEKGIDMMWLINATGMQFQNGGLPNQLDAIPKIADHKIIDRWGVDDFNDIDILPHFADGSIERHEKGGD